VHPVSEPLVFVVCGPGGVGKGTLVARLVERDPTLWLSRSWTTRERRPGEAADAYHFATRDEFEERIRSGGFLEWAEFLDHLYGTPTPDPPAGTDVVLEIEVQGAAQVKEQIPDAVLVVIDTPSRDEQAARMQGRGDDPDQIRRRLAAGEAELATAETMGATVVVNDDLDRAVDDLAAVIAAARAARAR
jgi:guanylate kinase